MRNAERGQIPSVKARKMTLKIQHGNGAVIVVRGS